MAFAIAVGVIIVAAVFIPRNVDVRLAVLGAAIVLSLIAGVSNVCEHARDAGFSATDALALLIAPLIRLVRTFLVTFCDERFVLPICLSMGFAHVLTETQCDAHLVKALIRPFKSARPLFIPGVILTGAIVNIPMISQGATAAAVGTVLVPVGRELGIPGAIIGSALVLGCSIGGELLNPGAPELRTIVEATQSSDAHADSVEVTGAVSRLLPWHLLVATTIFLVLNRSRQEGAAPATSEQFNVNYAKAVIPFVPILLLVALSPPLNVWKVPTNWLVADPGNKLEAKYFEARLIGATMLIGVVLAAASAPARISNVTKAFFTGTGWSLTHVISLIVAANCFGEAVKSIGVAEVFARFIAAWPGALLPVAAAAPMGFGAVAGSGIAATQSLFPLFVGPSLDLHINPVWTGAVVSLGAAAGRTMSPVSAVNLVSSTLTGVNPLEISKRVALPLVGGIIVVVLLATFH